MTPDLAPRQSVRGSVPPFLAIRVLEAANARRAAGLPVFDLSIGQPATGAPRAVIAATRAVLGTHPLGYTSALGIDPLRERIAGHYADTYGVQVDPGEVVITTGSSGAFLIAFLALFDAGDAVAVARPGYPAYRNLLHALGCQVVDLPCGPETGFLPTIQALEAMDPRPAGLLLASPANPTGTMMPAALLRDIARWCERTGVRLISDEIYHGLEFGRAAGLRSASAREFSDSAVVINSFSKYFSMTGWRIGWMLAPPESMDAMDRLAGNVALCPPTISQYAALAAFDSHDEALQNLDRYRANRAVLLDALPQMGITRIAPPDGAFYLYADVADLTEDSVEFCAHLLRDTGVAITPGVDFDPLDGHRYVRMCFAGWREDIEGAAEAMAGWLGRPR